MGTRITLTRCAMLLAVLAVHADPIRTYAQTATAPAAPACEEAPADGRSAVVGRLLDRKTRLPLQEADVVVEVSGSRRVEVETDEAGIYRACDLPAGSQAYVRASFGSAKEESRLTLEDGATAHVDFELDAPKSRAGGRVVEQGTSRGIASAEIRVRGSDVRTVSNADGSFALPDVPAGRYTLETSHIGYDTRADTVEVRYGAIMRYTINLGVNAIRLDPIDVTIRSLMLERRGFYQREHMGLGTFLTRQSWDERGLLYSSDVLRTVPGVRIVPRRAGGYLVLDRTNCAFRYVIDGIRVNEGFNIDDIPPSWIEALEIYRGPATVPLEFRPSPFSERAGCGVIVIWTRDTVD